MPKMYQYLISEDTAGVRHVSIFLEGKTGAIGHYVEKWDPWKQLHERKWLLKPERSPDA